MTRAAEFCYIAETSNGHFLQAVMVEVKHSLFTEDPEMALRITADGRNRLSAMFYGSIGFRKVLAG